MQYVSDAVVEDHPVTWKYFGDKKKDNPNQGTVQTYQKSAFEGYIQ